VSGPNGHEKLQRQFVIFACVAATLVLLLAWSQYQHGTARTIGLVVGLPVIVVLFIVADQFRRKIKHPEHPLINAGRVAISPETLRLLR
jgi:uncharacterized membrane protein